ncbi:MAG: phosphotransferase [Actinomycetota bacterium]|nr:phosphotransferase [Actinomycetota bacterium]
MRRAAAEAGLGADDVELFRASSAPLYRLAGHVARLCEDGDAADHEHWIGVELERAGVAAARPVAPPVHVGDSCVVFSAWIDHDPEPPTWHDVGLAAGRLHRATTTSPWTIEPLLDSIRARLDNATERGLTDPSEVQLLGGLLDEHGTRLAVIAGEDPLGWAISHGDLHPGNVIMAGGEPVLVDLELTHPGPCSYDVVPAMVAVDRYGKVPTALDEFRVGYGTPIPDWPGLAVMQTVYEVWLTIWSLTARDSSALHEREATVRLRHWTHDDPTPWSLL